MLTKRIIPCLDIRNRKVTKGVKFQGNIDLGDPVEMVQLHPDGTGEILTLGPDLAEGMRPQICVPAGTWQGSRLLPGGRFALLGTTMAPAFDPADYAHGDAEDLARAFPAFCEWIVALARPRP